MSSTRRSRCSSSLSCRSSSTRTRRPGPLAFLALGLVFNVTGTAWNLIVAWAAGAIARSRHISAVKAWLDRALGALFLALGARLAVTSQP